MTTKTRRSVPLEVAELARIDRISGDSDVEALLARHIGAEFITSEATLMRALVICGLELIEQEAAELRYQALAASQDEEDRAFHAALRARRRDS